LLIASPSISDKLYFPALHPLLPTEVGAGEIAARASAMRGGAFGRAYIRFM
jgi:hypothetical protein